MSQYRIIELSVKKLRGTLSPEEAVELEELEGAASRETLDAVNEAIEHEKHVRKVLRMMQLARPNFEANKKRLVYPADERRGSLKRIWMVPRLQRFVSVAAVVFAIMAGLMIWRKLSLKTESNLTAQTGDISKIKPVSNKAVLVLADGRSIVLDSASDGRIAQEGNTTVTKDADGKLSYKPLSNTDAVGFNTVNTPQGGQYYVELPDRTRVWLNAASSIRFPTAFTGADRSVTITGEAYLEVSKDQRHPFVVTLGETRVQVLGTHFNVKNYVEDGPAVTTLLEGSVQVSGGGGKGVTIKPGQAAISDPGGLWVNARADTSMAVAWKNGYLSFAGADITLIMNTIKRWYDVDIVYDGKKSLYKIQGTIPKNSNIDDVLKMLEIAGYKFTVKGKTIHVLP